MERKKGIGGEVVVRIGFEPMTSALSRRRSKPAELADYYKYRGAKYIV
jgi:hypothetical protein